MAKKNDVIESLLQCNDSKIIRTMKMAFNDYYSFIGEIAFDIYNSCIADFYDKYDPRVYGRHGDPKGFNLYQANVLTYSPEEYMFHLDPDSDELLPYGGEDGWGRREEVLDAVMSGIRGTTRRTKTRRKWPQRWTTSYPNGHSTHSEWSSSGTTIDEILDDFMDNILEDTDDLYWNYVEKYM